jgi:hypothetical protein
MGHQTEILSATSTRRGFLICWTVGNQGIVEDGRKVGVPNARKPFVFYEKQM